MAKHPFDNLTPAELKVAMATLLLQAAECMHRLGMTRQQATKNGAAMVTAAWDQALTNAAKTVGQGNG